VQALDRFDESDIRATLKRTLRLLTILTAVGMVMTALKFKWQSALLLLIGATISGSGLWEWMRLMSAVLARMDASAGEGVPGAPVRPMGWVLTGFFLRLAITIMVLYVSLKTLNGSVIALAVGLGLGILSLSVEAIRMARTWTM
jgi:hypothetical protein